VEISFTLRPSYLRGIGPCVTDLKYPRGGLNGLADRNIITGERNRTAAVRFFDSVVLARHKGRIPEKSFQFSDVITWLREPWT
jgi:hypothetical protein